MNNVMTIFDLIEEREKRANGLPTPADYETERRIASTARHQARLRNNAQRLVNHHSTSKRRDSPIAYNGGNGYKVPQRKHRGTTVTTTPEHTVDRETGELKATDARTFKRKKMSKMEFDGRKAASNKLYEKDSSGKWVHNCAAARTYRQQVWNHFNWRKADLSEQPPHPDVTAVQLAA